MAIFKKQFSLQTKRQIVDIFAPNPRFNTLNEKVVTYYLGRIPVASFVEDYEVVPDNKKFWRSKFEYMLDK